MEWTGAPATETSPEEGLSIPVIRLIRVVFPLPLLPTTAIHSPWRTSRSTFRSAPNRPEGVSYHFDTLLKEMIAWPGCWTAEVAAAVAAFLIVFCMGATILLSNILFGNWKAQNNGSNLVHFGTAKAELFGNGAWKRINQTGGSKERKSVCSRPCSF